MSQKIKKIVVLSFVLIISVVFTRCQKDDDLSNPEGNQISLAKNWFIEYESSSENYALLQNLNYDWNQASITKSEDGIETIVVPIIELKKDEREIWSQDLYIYKLEAGKYKALLFETYSNSNVELKSQSIEGGDFTGYMTVWDLKEGFVRAAKFVNNHVVEEGIAEFSNDKNLTNKAPADAPCIYADFGDGGCGGMSGGDSAGIALRPVIIPAPNTGIQLAPVIITVPSKGTPVIYNPRGPVIGGTTPGGYTSPSGGGGASSGGGGITAPTPVQITDMLIGKAKCLNALLNKNGDSFVQNLLANFQGKSEFDILIASKDVVTGKDSQGVEREINGRTLPPEGKSITIEISTSKSINNASLEVVRTILHEYIHADIFRKLETKLGTNAERLDFKTTFDAYGNQHNAIANLYLSSMKEALKAFHKNVLTDDYNKYSQYYGEVPSDAFYEALAWGGLRENNVKAWTDLPADKKAAIEALANRAPMLSKTVPCTN